MEFLYISSSFNASRLTPSMYVVPTHTYETAPLDLDILMIGGPDPAAAKEESLAFMRKASTQTKVILTTCSGAMWLARSGVLDGKKATTNRVTLASSKEQWPEVEWVDQRWVVEEGHFEGAQIWTSGGAGCGESLKVDVMRVELIYVGVDMLIEFADRTFNRKLVEIGCQGLDYSYENRSQFYSGPFEVIPLDGR
jgi:transcriptional regulator GlxA family with amidase domain